eukprot:gene4557-7941_t
MWKKYLSKGVIISVYASVISLSMTTGSHYLKITSMDKTFEKEKPGEYIKNFSVQTYTTISKTETKLPTVIFINGIGTTSDQFKKLYEKLSKHTNVLNYDRPGYGYSSSSKTPRHIANETIELESLLEKSGLPSPYIIVSEGYGSWISDAFSYQNPKLVLESIKFDPLHEQILEKTNYLSYSNLMKGNARFWLVSSYLGFMELILANENSYLRKRFLSYFDKNTQKIMKYHFLKSKFWQAEIGERTEIETSYEQLKEVSMDKPKPKSVIFLSNITKKSTFYDIFSNDRIEKTNEENQLTMVQSDEISDKIIKILKKHEK